MENYNERKKFFFRFLKDNGIYAAYRKYIFNPKTYNVYQTTTSNWSFDKCAEKYGMLCMLSMLITWDETREGYEYWSKLNKKYKEEFRKKFA